MGYYVKRKKYFVFVASIKRKGGWFKTPCGGRKILSAVFGAEVVDRPASLWSAPAAPVQLDTTVICPQGPAPPGQLTTTVEQRQETDIVSPRWPDAMEETDEDIIQLPEDADIPREQGDDEGGQPMENPGQGLD